MSDLIFKPQAILMVDDNEDDYESLVRAFKKVGLANPVILCRTGAEALDFLRHKGDFSEKGDAEDPILILLDLNMPGIDGHNVLRLIKEDAALKYIPVIIWTTSSNEKDIVSCYQAGANAYMQKPVSFEGLLESAARLKEYWFETAKLPGVHEQGIL